jgi:2,3-bisphosphoglycerate-independent phosphoglycerate mutase
MDRDNRWDRVKKGYDVITFAQPSTQLDITNLCKKFL